MAYPRWQYYPTHDPAPAWVAAVCELLAASRQHIDSREVDGLTSDKVLEHLRPGLESLGFEIETGKRKVQKVRRPVLFGESGSERVAYEVDGFHAAEKIVLEVEAGRGARGNAVYRDLIRASLIVDTDFLIIGVMQTYRHKSRGRVISVESYLDARDQLDAIYSSGRLHLPFKGILLVGY